MGLGLAVLKDSGIVIPVGSPNSKGSGSSKIVNFFDIPVYRFFNV
jgi:hypothetical protein